MRTFAFIFVVELMLAAPALGQAVQVHSHSIPSVTPTISREQMLAVNRERRATVRGMFGECVYNRGGDVVFSFISSTDYGFSSYDQIGMTQAELDRTFRLSDCVGRAIRRSRQSLPGLGLAPRQFRAMLIQQAYLKQYPDGPAWYSGSITPDPREYPVSGQSPTVHSSMKFADCVVATDPVGADFFYRTAEDSENERHALEILLPVIERCLDGGQGVPDPYILWLLLGEGLWHAAGNGNPASSSGARQ